MQTQRLRVRLPQTKAKARNFIFFNICISMLALLLFQLIFGVLTLPVAAAQENPLVPPTIGAKAGIAIDAQTGRILYSKNIHDRLPMASTTKLTTALTALSIPGVNLDDKITTIKSDLIGEASMGLRLNETVTFQDLLWGMLLNSGNDAAQTIARYAGSKLPGEGDPVARFVAQMNQFAGKGGLDLLNTHYANPHGLDQDNHYTSAYDLSRIGWYVLHNDLLSKIVKTQQAVAAGHSLVNINTFLKRYPGAIGIKPGLTDNAGLCLVGAAVKNGHTVIAVVLNTGDFNADVGAMMNYSFKLLDANGSNAGISQGGPSMNLLAKGDPSQYVGYPSGDKLLSPDQAQPNSVSNPVAASTQIAASRNIAADAKSDPFGFGQVVNAQVSSTTPDTSTTPGSGGNNGDNSGSTSKSSGPSLFVILLIVLVILVILYVVARMGFIAGETGKDIAYRVEEIVLTGGRGLRNFLGHLRPGNGGNDEVSTKDYRSQLPPPRTGNSSTANTNTEVNYRSRVQGTVRPASGSTTTPPTHSTSGRLSPSQDRPQIPSRPPLSYQNQPTSSSSTKRDVPENDYAAPISQNLENGSNPLEGFFDDATPFSFEENVTKSPVSNNDLNSKPPQPLRTPPANSSAAPTSKAGYDSSINAESLRDSVKPSVPPVSRSDNQITQTGQSSYSSSTPKMDAPRAVPSVSGRTSHVPNATPKTNNATGASSADSLNKRAQQAIDYAFAGRMQASTDEFRRVVEQDPVFDFGGLDDFEQMPVLGFKALATAYNSANKTRFGILLLELAIEKFPNDLELRNMLRTFKRETE